MSFFATDEPAEPIEPESPRRPWWDEPEDQLPGLAPVARLLARTDHLAVALIGARVYTDGVALLIEKRLRRQGETSDDWQELTRAFMGHFANPSGRMKFGVQLSDGQRATTTAAPFLPADSDAPPDGPVLSYRGGGSGGGNSFHSGRDTLWLWPLPPPGDLELVMQWSAFDIEETRVTLEATELVAAAARAAPIWTIES